MVRYPIGKFDFKAIREGGYLYVDKTDYIRLLLEGANYYFLARPRRFGKSMFVSTLEYFFKGERELFKGLAIDSYDWDWKQYPVIRIDFTGADYTKDSLEEKIASILSGYENEYGVSDISPLLTVRFERVIKTMYERTGLKAVVLVDEYEKPVVDNLDNESLMNSNRETLSGFYSVLKALDGVLKFVFLTGVTKFGQMNVFSGLNNMRDISLENKFGAICGITENELIQNFQEGIEKLSESEETDYEGALHILKKNYDGYHFSSSCPDIYNPFSIVTAMDSDNIGWYWARTGTPKLLVNILLRQNYDLQDLNGINATAERLLGVDNQFTDPVALFFQTGYLTIKSFNKQTRSFKLGFPNVEVEQAFFNYLLPDIINKDRGKVETVIYAIGEDLIKGNPEKAMNTLEAFTAGISYDLIPEPEIERHFQTIIYLTIKLLLPFSEEIRVEDRTSDGRSDILIKTDSYIYIMELKVDSSAETALNQIVQKQYALPYSADPRVKYLIGLNFSTEKKRLDNFKIIRL